MTGSFNSIFYAFICNISKFEAGLMPYVRNMTTDDDSLKLECNDLGFIYKPHRLIFVLYGGFFTAL